MLVMTKMKNEMMEKMLDKRLVIAGVEPDSRQEVLQKLSQLLKEMKYTNEDFQEGVEKREKEFPTGLVTPGGNVAIPHTDPEHVKKPAIAVASLKKPVDFFRMDKQDEKIPVRTVFMLAVSKKENQVKLIKRLSTSFKESNLIAELESAQDKEEIFSLLVDSLS